MPLTDAAVRNAKPVPRPMRDFGLVAETGNPPRRVAKTPPMGDTSSVLGQILTAVRRRVAEI